MSKMIKDDSVQEYIKKENLVKQIGHIAFSFKYLSNNNAYGKKAVDKADIHAELFERMIQLSHVSIMKARAEGKIQGCEPIKYGKFNTQMKTVLDNIEIIQKDSTLSVFRFGNQKYRMICKSDDAHANVLYIIGFDIDFTAYNH